MENKSVLDVGPPELSQKEVIDKNKYLLCYNNGKALTLDFDDWQLAKHLFWYDLPQGVVNGVGVSLEEYLKIRGIKSPDAGKYDFSRKHYKEV